MTWYLVPKAFLKLRVSMEDREKKIIVKNTEVNEQKKGGENPFDSRWLF